MQLLVWWPIANMSPLNTDNTGIKEGYSTGIKEGDNTGIKEGDNTGIKEGYRRGKENEPKMQQHVKPYSLKCYRCVFPKHFLVHHKLGHFLVER
jgi:hypothetical protein